MELLDTALLSGLKEEEFWNMTIGEVSRYIKAFNKRKNIEDKNKAMNNYILANLISEQVACIFDNNSKPRAFKDVYSFLFSEEEQQEFKRQEEEHLAKITAAKFREYADAVNEQRNR